MHKVRISFQTELMTCTSSAAGLAAAHVLPRLLLGIHKLRLIPAVWCHLHQLPQGVIFNMGPLLFHRALCWGGYICVISVQACIYLSTHVHVCVLMRLCEHVWVRTGEKSLLLCIFTRPPTGLFTWNITAEIELNTSSWAIFPVMQQHFSSKSNESLSAALEVGYIPESSWWCEGKGLEPPYIACCLARLHHYFDGFWGQSNREVHYLLWMNQSTTLFCSLTCGEVSRYICSYVTFELRNSSNIGCISDWNYLFLSSTSCK